MSNRTENEARDQAARREHWRLQEFGCIGGPHVEAAILHLFARAIDRPIDSMPRPNMHQLWTGFLTATRCNAVKLDDLPLEILSYGERFALAVGVLFSAEALPVGETFREIIDNATECGFDLAGALTLSATLQQDSVRRIIPLDVLRLHGDTFEATDAVNVARPASGDCVQ